MWTIAMSVSLPECNHHIPQQNEHIPSWKRKKIIDSKAGQSNVNETLGWISMKYCLVYDRICFFSIVYHNPQCITGYYTSPIYTSKLPGVLPKGHFSYGFSWFFQATGAKRRWSNWSKKQTFSFPQRRPQPVAATNIAVLNSPLVEFYGNLTAFYGSDFIS